MVYNKERNHRRSNNWCSQDGINQKFRGCSGKINARAQSKPHHRSKREISSKIVDSPLGPPLTNLVDMDAGTPNLSGLTITGIVIGSLIGLTIIVYCLILFVKRRKNPSQDEEEGELPTNPRELTINFVKHNHAIPELCTTPDTQPILDYYSSKAGLAPANKNNNDRKSIKSIKSIPVEVSESTKRSSEENINNDDEYVPQYYNGMEIPPLGARIIPLERQVQIAKEFTSSNLSPTNNKRKSNRSISSILSISSKRKSTSTTNTTNNNYYNHSNSSTTNTLSLIRETPRKLEGKL